MRYHHLYTFEESAGRWAPQFGDYCREEVEIEREGWLDSPRTGCYGAYPAAFLKIVTFPRCPTQRQVDEKGASLSKPKGV